MKICLNAVYRQYANQHVFHGSGQPTTGRKHSVANQNVNNTESFARNHIPEGGCELSERGMDATEM